MSDACFPAASTSASSSRSRPQPCCARIWFVYCSTSRSCALVPPPLGGGCGVSLGVGSVVRVLVGVVRVGFGSGLPPGSCLVLRGAEGRTITVVTPTVGAVGLVRTRVGVSLGVLVVSVPAGVCDVIVQVAAPPSAGVPTTAVVVRPFGSVLVTVIIGTPVFVVPSTAPPSWRVSSETFSTLVASLTVELSRDISQTTGPIARRTDNALTIGPVRPRLRRGARLLPRCRRGVGESVMGGRILFVFVVPSVASFPVGSSQVPPGLPNSDPNRWERSPLQVRDAS